MLCHRCISGANVCVKNEEIANKKIDPNAWDKRLNDINFFGCHNCYINLDEYSEGYDSYYQIVKEIPALELGK